MNWILVQVWLEYYVYSYDKTFICGENNSLLVHLFQWEIFFYKNNLTSLYL